MNEYFYDSAAGKLYFMPNTTDQNADGSPKVALAEVPTIANFFALFGAEEAPVANVSFSGITFTGGRPTIFDPHGQPSGGDWALERMGALLFEGTEDVVVADCLFERIDSNAVFISGYNRRTQVLRNEFSLLGNNAVASWGRSVDWDGTGGQQPRHSLIMGNIVHDSECPGPNPNSTLTPCTTPHASSVPLPLRNPRAAPQSASSKSSPPSTSRRSRARTLSLQTSCTTSRARPSTSRTASAARTCSRTTCSTTRAASRRIMAHSVRGAQDLDRRLYLGTRTHASNAP